MCCARYGCGALPLLFLLAVLCVTPGCGTDAGNASTSTSVPANGGPSSSITAPPPAPDTSNFVGDRLAGYKPQSVNPTVPQEPSPFRFADIVPGSGIDFKHFSGMTKDKHFPTANGSGAAVFDYDGDGKLDLYFATCCLIPPGSPKSGPNRLYRNLGNGKYQDVTEASGLGFAGFCHGIVVGDIDNDGDPDVVLANYGPNRLYLNNGNGTFQDISESSGIARQGWSSGGAFLDYDNDGDLDLYLSNYGDWQYPKDDKWCGDAGKKIRMYCSPREVRTVRHFFYRNNGDHTFTDVTEKAGIARNDGHGFGVVAAQLDEDGLIDLYVANDQNPAFLFLNNGDGTFRDATDISGAGYDEKGGTQAGMGVDAEDIDGDGKPELIKTHFANEYNTLYQNLGGGNFFDQSALYGIAADSMPWVKWGCGFIDFDSDGWPDLFVADGHVDDNREGIEYAEPPMLHRNAAAGDFPGGGRRFKLSTRDVGPYFSSKHVARGVAFGDIDDDGDIDIVVNHKDGTPAVLRNDTPRGDNAWIRLKLIGTVSNRDAIGSRVEAVVGKRTIYRQVKGGVSMESAHDLRLLIGLGPVTEVEKLTIRWPRGAVTTLEHVAVGKTHEIREPGADAKPAEDAKK